MTRILALAFLLAACGSTSNAPADDPHQDTQEDAVHGSHGKEHGKEHGHHGGKHGNPGDMEAYVAKMVDPERDAWQQPDKVVEALGLTPGQTACDIGVGPGYFALRMASTVGESGRIFGVDVEPRMVEELRSRLEASGQRNVIPVLALPDDPLLPDAACDLILVVDTYHHFPDGPAYLARLARALKPGGRLVNIDFHKRDNPVGPAKDHLVDRADFLRDAESAGLQLDGEQDFLAHQYFLTLKRR